MISKLTVVGRSLETFELGGDQPVATRAGDPIFDRQIRALGSEGQERLRRAAVGIVGAGGTGSAIAEQVARLGVEDIVLIDKDEFDPSNLTRMYGSFFADTIRPRFVPAFRRRRGRRKTDIVAKHIARINPKARVSPVHGHVASTSVVRRLLDRDVIFCCTDDHWGRSVVNQIAYQYLIPVINMGVRIDSAGGRLTGATGSVDILRPGKPCLWCRGFLRPERIRAESLPDAERHRLALEGYVEGLVDPAPSVVSMTTTVAGLAVTQFLQMLTDFMGGAGDVSSLRYSILEGVVRRGGLDAQSGCVCGSVRGYGDMKPLPAH